MSSPKVYVVSAFPDRRARLLSSPHLKDCEVEVIDTPPGSEVALQGAIGADLWPDVRWRDPIERRLLTWGEMSCFAGHREAWRRIAQDDSRAGAVILEDDAELLAPPGVGAELVEPRLVYLGYQHRSGGGQAVPGVLTQPSAGIPREAVTAGYCYWTVGYYVPRPIAQTLAAAAADVTPLYGVLPVDEFLGIMIGDNPLQVKHERGRDHNHINAARLKEPIVQPTGTESSTTSTTDYAFNLLTVLPASDAARAQPLVDALEALGHRVVVVGKEGDHWDTKKEGGRRKIEWLRDWWEHNRETAWVANKGSQTIILTMDAYDVMPTRLATPAECLRRYGEMGRQIVCAGETQYWPAREAGFEQQLIANYPAPDWQDSPHYRFPNSGWIMGDEGAMASFWKQALTRFPSEQDDQALLHKWATDLDIIDQQRLEVDREGYLCVCTNGESDDLLDSKLRNKYTGCCPLFVHANGLNPPDLSAVLAGTPRNLPTAAQTAVDQMNDDREWQPLEVAPGILLFRNVLDPDAARGLAGVLDAVGGWGPLDKDAVPGVELRLRVVDQALHDGIAKALDTRMPPHIKARWHPANWTGVSDLFAIRYRADEQPNIRLHNDISGFSGSLVLDRQHCAGGDLTFPRQTYDDRHLQPGDLLIWPGPITHPHEVVPVRGPTSRMSLVIWTKT